MRETIRALPALLAGLFLLASVPAATGAAPLPRTAAGGKSKVFMRLDEALELCFEDCAIERGTVYLKDAQRRRIEELAGSELASGIVHPYVAKKDGKVVGTAYVDTHRVRTLRETMLVVVDPDGKVARLELLAFAEPRDYVPGAAWYGQFVGRVLDDELSLKRSIRGVTGATLTAEATTEAVRRSLAVHRVLGAASTAAR